MPTPPLFQSPDQLRVLWHDLLKTPTAMRAFAENAREGIYGRLSPDLQKSLSTLEGTVIEQELLIRMVQMLTKCDTGASLGTPQQIQVATSIKAAATRMAPWLTNRKTPVALAIADATLTLPKEGWDGLLALLFGAAGFLPQGTNMRLTGTIAAKRYTLALTGTKLGTLPPEMRATKTDALFNKTPTPFTNAARCLFTLRKLTATLGGKTTTAPNTLIQITFPL